MYLLTTLDALVLPQDNESHLQIELGLTTKYQAIRSTGRHENRLLRFVIEL